MTTVNAMTRRTDEPSPQLTFILRVTTLTLLQRLAPGIVLATGLILSGMGCRATGAADKQQLADAPSASPRIVFVKDFEVDPAAIESHEGILADLPGPGRVVDRVVYGQEPAAKLGPELVNRMSNDLVRDIKKAGLDAVRLAGNEPLPTNGWLVRGTFRRVDEGNRLRRSIVGFGSGKTDIVLAVLIEDLSQGPARPLVELETERHSRALPGAAPFIAINPYSAAARFVLAGGDLRRNVSRAAAEIAREVVAQVKQTQ